MIQLNGYKFTSKIYHGRNSMVYGGLRENDRLPIVLKLLNKDYPTIKERGRFKREFELTHNLNTKGTIQVYSIEKFENSLAIIMEDFGGEPLSRTLRERCFNLDEFFSLAIRITEILGDIHRNKIIHKDINPSNILWNPLKDLVKIIDFGISSKFPREVRGAASPGLLEGTLTYISPEQTGRMNRALDYRTDFYSLGATFYEMLLGQPPFFSGDAIEMVHAHIAKIPPSPRKINPDLPSSLCGIIAKLMAKSAEDRYQSARGVIADLKQCQATRASDNRIHFEIGAQDFSSNFQIPQKLYGRESELRVLLATFERVSAGSGEIVMLGGYSGVGKSALVNEIQKPAVARRGFYIQGKFDQLQSNIPYSALLPAIADLTRIVLSETRERLTLWKQELGNTLGGNGRVLIDFIPELESILGPLPPVPELGPRETQNRFNLVFQNFIRVFARKEHPLVLFLDDLQWADQATLTLLEILAKSPDIKYLLLVGAYRDNEVASTHPLRELQENIEKAGPGCFRVNRISVPPLQENSVRQLLADTLHQPLYMVKPLGSLVMAKTGGNPFFTGEFLHTLYLKKLIKFNIEHQVWEWNISQIKHADITDNVISLMLEKIRSFPEVTRRTLTLAACIGNHFDLETLAIISKQSLTRTVRGLWPAFESVLLLPQGDNHTLLNILDDNARTEGLNERVKFQHDRIQQAAYEMIDESRRKQIHLEIGRLLLINSSPPELEKNLFDIVRHLNLGRELITERAERETLAHLNLKAGRKAKKVTAYNLSFIFFTGGLALLEIDESADNRSRIFEFYLEIAETCYLLAQDEQATRALQKAMEYARSKLEKGQVFRERLIQYASQGKYTEAILQGVQASQLFNIHLPDISDAEGIKQALRRETETFNHSRGNKDISELQNLPVSEDPEFIIINEILGNLMDSALVVDPLYSGLIALLLINLAGQSGLTPHTLMGFSFHSITLKIMGDYDSAYEFTRLSLKINEEKVQAKNISSKLYAASGSFISYLKKHLKESIQDYEQAYSTGLESGDFLYASYALSGQMRVLISVDLPLSEVEKRFENILTRIAGLNNRAIYELSLCLKGFVLNLQGATQRPDSINFENFQEREFRKNFGQVPMFIALLEFYRFRLFFLYEDYDRALELYFHANFGPLKVFFHIHEILYYGTLCLTAVFDRVGEEKQKTYLVTVQDNLASLKKLNESSPLNFSGRVKLIEGELSRIKGDLLKATLLYEEAARFALENEYISVAALANELAGKLWLKNGNKKYARIHLKDAHYFYQQWGARVRVEQLEKKYSWIFEESEEQTRTFKISETFSTSTSEAKPSEALDMISVVKASRTISEEIKLEKLLTRLIKIIGENAGARKGFLILLNNARPRIEASLNLEPEKIEVLQSEPLEENPDLSSSIVRYTIRTGKNVIIHDSQSKYDSTFVEDPYLKTADTRSLICLPIRRQDKITGAVYLENNLNANVFTDERADVLQILIAQAAISLENARVYDRLEELVLERTEELEKTHNQLMETAHHAGMAEVAAEVLHNVGNALNSAIVPTGLLKERLAKSRLPGLKKVGEMLEEHRDDLSNYLTRDKKGKKIPEFINTLSDYLLEEKDKTEDILNHLQDSLNYIKETLLKQQAYIGTQSHIETLSINDLLEDVLRIETEKNLRDNIEITRNYSETPRIRSGRHRLMFIIHNLLSNARNALRNLNHNSRKICLQTEYHDGRGILIKVIDNGTGIEPGLLDKIFRNGFSTEENARGFGLHSAANAAAKLGGQLSAHSTGKNQGATFILKLPV